MSQTRPRSLTANTTGTTYGPAKRVRSRTSLSEQHQSFLFHFPGLQNQPDSHTKEADKKADVAAGTRKGPKDQMSSSRSRDRRTDGWMEGLGF